MRTPQLLSGAIALACATATACTRAEVEREARNAAAGAQAVAAKAGERLADGWLTTKVQAQFFADNDIKSRYLNVSTRDGIVLLSGYVDSQKARQEAVQIARNTDGVKRVDDTLMIGRAPSEAFEPVSPTEGAVATTGSDSEASIAANAQLAGRALEDERITTTVQARFFLDPALKGRAIGVATRNGVVTLRGSVQSETEHALALLVARNTIGVGRVEDLLMVTR